jgi:hypothetical protein
MYAGGLLFAFALRRLTAADPAAAHVQAKPVPR